MKTMQVCFAAVLLGLASVTPAFAQASDMTFFLTSAGPGDGANLGGLAGADAHCQSLAAAVGAGGKTWRAYLSTQGSNGVSARDRIGSGPWFNSEGVQIAGSVDELHYSNAALTKETQLDENGKITNGRTDTPNRQHRRRADLSPGIISDPPPLPTNRPLHHPTH